MRKSGQTALILILLAAAALIILAITLNWGRITQTKLLLTTSAYQSASLLASEAASYGEMQKEQYLNNQNTLSGLAAWVVAIITLGMAIVALVVKLVELNPVGVVLAIVSVIMAVTNLVLQVAVVGSMTTTLWNKSQKDQPVQQQFFEQGIGNALQGTVTDQANITDYFDSNANGHFGNNTFGFPVDTIGRFDFFYSERQKMLDQPLIPGVVDFYNQLGELNNSSSMYSTSANPTLTIGLQPYASQLNDACSNLPYNPYCDPCCQPVEVLDPFYNQTVSNPLHPNKYKSLRPSYCSPPNDTSANGAPYQCYTNNPYNNNPGNPSVNPPAAASNDSPYTLLYDPTYQNYGIAGSKLSLLDQLGRDEQEYPFYFVNQGGAYPYITPKGGAFPNGIFPFFWLMKDYSPQVDNINPVIGPTNPTGLLPSQWHWCTSNYSQPNGPAPDIADQNLEEPWPPNPTAGSTNPLTAYPPRGFPDLAQLSLPYACAGQDCCVNVMDNFINATPPPNLTNCPNTQGWIIDEVGDPSLSGLTLAPTSTNPTANPAIDPSLGEASSTCTGTATGNTSGQCSWQEGDDQLCATPTTPPPPFGWPYNGAATIPNLPDGICEWTGPPTPSPTETAAAVQASLPNGGNGPPYTLTWTNASVDKLDDDVHTLSDFVNFSDNFLGQDLGILSATFDTWYAQAATWFAPACQNDPPENLTCNPGEPGRLLNIYQDPDSKPSGDDFSDWNANLITPWLSNNYTSDAWCVPQEASLETTAPKEHSYISGAGIWGQMPSILACMAYNGTKSTGQSQGAIYNYSQCLQALTQNNGAYCKANPNGPPPPACDPSLLGRDLLAATVPQFIGTSTTGIIPSTPVCTCAGTNGCYDPVSQQNYFGGCTMNTSSSASAGCSCGATATTPPPAPATACSTTTITPGAPLFCASNTPSPLPKPTQITNITTNWECSDTYGCECTNSEYVNNFDGGGCNPAIPGGYAAWVTNSLTVIEDEAPKFDLRGQFLADVYNRAMTAQNVFQQGAADLTQFLGPGGPAAQLMQARSQPQPTTVQLPNAVIYGWIDKTLANGQTLPPVDGVGGGTGYAHIVKVTAYAPGRYGSADTAAFAPLLPWIKTITHAFTRTYELTDRDGYVYVSIKRWDEEHGNSIISPNGRPLWQFSFHNPKAQVSALPTTIGNGSLGPCAAVYPAGSGIPMGWGLEPLTALGLQASYANISQPDQKTMAQAFMLNDEGAGANAGTVDPSATSPSYLQCLNQVNQLLATAPESHACAEYIASPDATGTASGCSNGSTDGVSCNEANNYSLKFINCSSIPGGAAGPPPDDMTGTSS